MTMISEREAAAVTVVVPEKKPLWQTNGLGVAPGNAALAEANLAFLESVAHQAAGAPQGRNTPAVLGLNGELAARVLRLLPAERSRLAEAPFALFDLRFGDALFWSTVMRAPAASAVASPSLAGAAGRVRWVRGATVLAWHLAQRGGLQAALTVGMTPAVQALWAGMRLGVLETVAIAAEDVLAARWASHPRFWIRMLTAVERDDETALAMVRHLGWQLLATDGLRPVLARRRLPRD